MAFLASGTIDDGGPNGRKSGGFGEVRLLRYEADLVQGGIFPAGGPFLRDDLFQEGVSTSLEVGITFGGFEFALRAREGAEKNEKRVAADHGSSEFFGVEHSIEGILLERDLEPGSLFLFGMKKWEGEGGGETGSQKGSAGEVEMKVHFEWAYPYLVRAGFARGNWSSLAGSAVPR